MQLRGRSKSKSPPHSAHNSRSPVRRLSPGWTDLTPGASARSGGGVFAIPIIEADEDETNTDTPIFPVFSSGQELRPDESAANEIPYPTEGDVATHTVQGQKQRINCEIESDFDKEFNQDTHSVLDTSRMPTGARRRLDIDSDSSYDTEDELSDGDMIDDQLTEHSLADKRPEEAELEPAQRSLRDSDSVRPPKEGSSSQEEKPIRSAAITKNEMSNRSTITTDDTTGKGSLGDRSPGVNAFPAPYPDAIQPYSSGSRHYHHHHNSNNNNNNVGGGEAYPMQVLSPPRNVQHNPYERPGSTSVDIERGDNAVSVDERNLLDEQDMKDAQDLVGVHLPTEPSTDGLISQDDEFDERINDGCVGLPDKVRPGITSNLMRLYDPGMESEREELLPDSDDLSQTGPQNNKKDRSKKHVRLRPLFSNLSATISNASLHKHARSASDFDLPTFKATGASRKANAPASTQKNGFRRRLVHRPKRANTARITVHIADILQRQRFLMTLCKAFMIYGAPNHRLEEYLKSTAKVLEVDASFVYFPDMIIVTFGDPSMRTSEVKVVRVTQGLDLAKLDDAHEIYKAVVHDRIGVDEASQRLDDLMKSKPVSSKYELIIYYGLASMCSLIWFDGCWRDMGPGFIFGCILGFLQLVVAPLSTLYSSVFEVGSCILLAFIGRAVGSINGGKTFCFSALVQSGIVMILPGYMILSGALEIQSRSMVSGTVKTFYAVIYSLFMGFGMTLGAALYGWIDHNAVNTTTCPATFNPIWNILFIPGFTIFATLGTEARLKQLPIMTVIACAGYAVNYFSKGHFGSTQFNASLGAFIIGMLSHLYSRIGMPFKKITYCGSAFTTMFPGIIDMVPGSVASRNVLAAGISQLNSIKSGSDSSSVFEDSTLSFGMTMIEISIAISVGLFVSAAIAYPFGKKKTGIFSL